MTYARIPNGIFHGGHIVSAGLSGSHDYYMGHFLDGTIKRHSGPLDWTLDIDLLYENLDELDTVFSLGVKDGAVMLGDGLVCPHCGTYWPNGNYYCYNCGGDLEARPFIKPHSFPFLLVTKQVSTPSAGYYEVGLRYYGTASDIDVEFMNTLCYGKSKTRPVPAGTGIVRGYYLCEWCGLAVESGKTCYGCAGPRTPLRELVEMDRECVWCGTKTDNGIICKACGTRVGGKSIDEVFYEQDRGNRQGDRV